MTCTCHFFFTRSDTNSPNQESNLHYYFLTNIAKSTKENPDLWHLLMLYVCMMITRMNLKPPHRQYSQGLPAFLKEPYRRLGEEAQIQACGPLIPGHDKRLWFKGKAKKISELQELNDGIGRMIRLEMFLTVPKITFTWNVSTQS